MNIDLETINKTVITHSKLQISSNLNALVSVLNWFESFRQPFIPSRAWIECQTVLGEAFDNAVSHAHEGLSSDTPVEIELEIFSQLMILKIWDRGPGFDLESQRIKVSYGVDNYAENGRGVQIFERATDYFNYSRQEDGRNCLLIIKLFTPQLS